MAEKLLEVVRGELVESIHRGDIVVTDGKGNLLYSLGNPDRMTFFRSTAKPLQIIALLETGIAVYYGLDLREIAILMSSHTGEKQHIDVLTELLKKTGIKEEALNCGIHEPYNAKAAKDLHRAGLSATRLHCNCSGKHIGLIAASKLLGLSLEDYAKPEHPIQDIITRVLSDFTGLERKSLVVGTDGCGAAVYGLPLRHMARAYANLCDLEFMDGKYRNSQNYVLGAMSMYPEMIAGTDRFDTDLIKSFGSLLISKTGAEGAHCSGFPGKGAGTALKIEDGSLRAVAPVYMELLVQLGILKKDEAESLKLYHNPVLQNNRGDAIGRIRSVFKLSGD